MLGNSIWDFLGVNFLVKGFFEVLIFSTVRSSPSLEIRSTPPGTGSTQCRYCGGILEK